MTIWTKLLLSAALVLGLSGVASAGPEGKKARKGKDVVKGQISNVIADGDSSAKIVVLAGRKKAPQEVTVMADSNTTVTVDGQPAKLSELKTGHYVLVRPATGTATSIQAMLEAPSKAKKAKKQRKAAAAEAAAQN